MQRLQDTRGHSCEQTSGTTRSGDGWDRDREDGNIGETIANVKQNY